ncbi:GGDEF domain-containing protein [Rheinheimera sp. 1928-s]|uniref:GGDEF domain-containing protein n=1 Tax=Rheinheimera sp. 1928-s TaxID=3033803 RepID=UPI002613FACB|nr:GGDEF domain-containing protein [Rheinheimera sp. 1928-s]MDF3126739.1 GGDEF domain-containing protein [Rheinheimera sp. 1928-s]
MLQRLKDNFHLSMITLVGVIASCTLLPYALYRLATGSYLVGIVDMLMIAVSTVSVWMAWRTGDTEKPGFLMAAVFCFGAVLVCMKLGQDVLFWIYPLMVFIFFLVAPIKALLLLLLMVSAIVSLHFAEQSSIFNNGFQLLAFITTTLITSIFAYIFAYRTHLQRQELRHLATTDPLTGAATRHSLTDELTAAIEQYQQKNSVSGLMLLDLDHFKRINDNFGHQSGDQILSQLVPLLKQMIRQQDSVFRYGGEEFVLLIKEIQLADLHRLAEKIRHAVWHQLALPDGSALTTSIGIATVQQATDWESWLQQADVALYQAKHQGRNQVVIATGPEVHKSNPS